MRRELDLPDVVEPRLDGVFQHEVDGLDFALLADAVHAPDPLLDAHGF